MKRNAGKVLLVYNESRFTGGKMNADSFRILWDKIMMFWNDHMPPHFHAEYGDSRILVDIKTGMVIKGVFSSKQLKLVLAWCEIHREELLQNWENALKHEKLYRINPLV